MTGTERESTWTFFRQSGWLVMANGLCGFFMAAVHPFASSMPEAEYADFCTLLRAMLLAAIPVIGLQTAFARQAAAAVTEESQRELAGTTRTVLLGILAVWLVAVAVFALLRVRLIATFEISSPAAVWITLPVVLAALWIPILHGLLQGRQDFLWLGWSMIFNGLGRLGAVMVGILLLGVQAAGAMAGALIGVAGSLALAGWPLRRILALPGGRFVWRPWFKQALALTFSSGSSLFVMNADLLVVKSHFGPSITAYYAAPAMIGLALVTFTTPLAAVMFPKIVRSIARSEKSDALSLAFATTAGLAGIVALTCTVVPELPLRVMYFRKPEFWVAAPLVPWFAWSVLPITVANVLIVNLMAWGRFRVVPWLVTVAVAYGICLGSYVVNTPAGPFDAPEESFRAFRGVVQILGVFSTLLLGVAAWFTWGAPRKSLG